MINEPNSIVSVRQFVNALIASSPVKPDATDCMNYGYQAGWLEDIDITAKDEPLLKKNAARIAHEFMRLELHEPDNEDISSSIGLRDLYDCRVCTKHIMQVAAKGVMKGYYIADTLYLFGINDKITCNEMYAIINRIFHPAFRINA